MLNVLTTNTLLPMLPWDPDLISISKNGCSQHFKKKLVNLKKNKRQRESRLERHKRRRE